MGRPNVGDIAGLPVYASISTACPIVLGSLGCCIGSGGGGDSALLILPPWSPGDGSRDP